MEMVYGLLLYVRDVHLDIFFFVYYTNGQMDKQICCHVILKILLVSLFPYQKSK